MTDFDYSEYDSQTLQNAISNCQKDIKKRQQLIKDFSKILNRPRGYSKKKLDGLAYRIDGASAGIKMLEQEIDECRAELERR